MDGGQAEREEGREAEKEVKEMSGCNWFMLLLGFVVGITCGACGEADAHKEKYERERRELVERAEFWRHQLELFNEVRGYETLRHQ